MGVVLTTAAAHSPSCSLPKLLLQGGAWPERHPARVFSLLSFSETSLSLSSPPLFCLRQPEAVPIVCTQERWLEPHLSEQQTSRPLRLRPLLPVPSASSALPSSTREHGCHLPPCRGLPRLIRAAALPHPASPRGPPSTAHTTFECACPGPGLALRRP